MGRRSREKRQRRELLQGEVKEEKRGRWMRKPQARPVFVLKGLILGSVFLALFTPLIGPPFTSGFFFPYVGPKSIYFMGLVELAFFSWLALILLDRRFYPKFNLVFLGLLLFLVVFILSGIFGVDPSYSFWSKFERMTGILMFLHLFALFLVLSSTFDKEDWKKVFSVSIFVGAFIALIALLSREPSMRNGATIGNDSFLGTYLLFNIFISLYLILTSKKELRIYSSACFLIMAFVLLVGGSQGLVSAATALTEHKGIFRAFLVLFEAGARAAKISFLGGLLLLSFLWLIFEGKKRFRFVGIFLLITSLTTSGLLIYFSLKPGNIVHKEAVRLFGSGVGARLAVWNSAWQGFLERPYLGWGPENFEFAFDKYYNPCMGTPRCGGEIWFDRAHNIIFDTLVANGAIGLFFYLLLFLFIFYHSWRNYFRKRFNFWIPGVFSVLLLTYFIQNLTVFDMVNSYMMLFLVFSFIAQKDIDKEAFSPSVRLSLLYPLFFILGLAFFACQIYFVIGPLRSDAFVISALKSPAFSEEQLSFYKKAIYSSPVGRHQIRGFFTDSFLGSLRKQGVNQGVLKGFDFLEKELRKDIKENPMNYRAYLKLAQILNIYPGDAKMRKQRLDEAEKILEKAIEISPNNQQGYWYLAQTKIGQGKPNQALSLAEAAVKLEPEMERSHLILIQIAQWIGKKELAQKKAEEALKINPAWKEDIDKIFKKPD